jgi:hypothetical protein
MKRTGKKKTSLPRGRWINGKIHVSRSGKVQVKVSPATVRRRKPANPKPAARKRRKRK